MVKIDYTFPDNPIKIGQNSQENDKMISEAKQNDMWFHLSNLPSCHVIIAHSDKQEITKQMILYCANLVKQNTKFRNLHKIRINYTFIKNVRKTTIPGKVNISGKMESIVV